MKALVFNGPRDIRYEDFADPELGSDNSVILKVEKCSICGSDLHMYHGDNIGSADYGGDIPKFCVGHEFTGEVVDVGRDVHQYKIGDKVLAAGGAGCGKCTICKSGNGYACRKATAFGLSNELNGGQAELVNIPNADQTLTQIPDGVSDEQAVLLTDGMATAYFGITRANVAPGSTVAIVGLGPIGLIGVELAFILGASRVYAVDPVAERRAHAEKLGAVALTPDDALPRVYGDTNSKGAPSVFEASGVKAAIDLAVSLTAGHGTASFIGLPQGGAALDMMAILYKDITIRAGICPVPEMWKNLIPLLQSGRLKAEGLFSHNMALSEGAEAYRMFDAREDGVIKIMMDVG